MTHKFKKKLIRKTNIMTEMDGSSHQSETCQEGLFWQRDESIHSQPGRISANREMLAALVLGWSRLGGTM